MTHDKRGDVVAVSPVILQHLLDTNIVQHVERGILSCGIEVSGILYWIPRILPLGNEVWP